LGKNNATCKVFAQAFFKKLGESRRRNGGRSPQRAKSPKRRFSFCKAFSFAPCVSKEKALWAEKVLKNG